MRRLGRLAPLGAIVFWAQPAWAQLSDVDLAEIHGRIEKEGWTFTVGENDATKYPLEVLCRSQPIPGFRLPVQDQTPETVTTETQTRLSSIPSSFDWRTWNCVTPIRNQGFCGSCWAFAAISVMESAICINDRSAQDLSEQWLVSCTTAGNCIAGRHDQALDFLTCAGQRDACGNSGAVLELGFPYQAAMVPCGCPYWHPFCLTSWAFVSWPFQATEQQLKQAIFDHGPIAVSVFADPIFQAYTGGVFNSCTNNQQTNHSVVLVGWDDNQGVWIMRNCWGTGWGEGGYMRIQYGCSRIGFDAVQAVYADSDNAVWVDFGSSGTPTGSFWAPYPTLGQAAQNVQDSGVIAIKAGNIAETLTITKAVTLEAVGGAVTIGQ